MFLVWNEANLPQEFDPMWLKKSIFGGVIAIPWALPIGYVGTWPKYPAIVKPCCTCWLETYREKVNEH